MEAWISRVDNSSNERHPSDIFDKDENIGYDIERLFEMRVEEDSDIFKDDQYIGEDIANLFKNEVSNSTKK